MFFGEYKRHLDEKGRVMVPAEFRGLFSASVYITMGFDHCLMILMQPTYDQLLHDINKLSITNPNARNLRRTFMSKSRLVQIDGSSRIRIPSELSDNIQMQPGSEIVLAGNGSYIEIWTAAEWEQINLSLADPVLNAERYQSFDIIFADPQDPPRNPPPPLPQVDLQENSE